VTFEHRAGLFLVRYDGPDALSPERQASLEAELRSIAAHEPVAIVFVVGQTVKAVEHDVPDYWLGLTTDRSLRIAAMAVVTPNPGVSVATRGFSTANILRDTAVAVKPFADEGQAVAWAQGQLDAVRMKGASTRG
jgi:hypothetical protein